MRLRTRPPLPTYLLLRSANDVTALTASNDGNCPSQSLPGSKITVRLRLDDAPNAENEENIDSHRNNCERR